MLINIHLASVECLDIHYTLIHSSRGCDLQETSVMLMKLYFTKLFASYAIFPPKQCSNITQASFTLCHPPIRQYVEFLV